MSKKGTLGLGFLRAAAAAASALRQARGEPVMRVSGQVASDECAGIATDQDIEEVEWLSSTATLYFDQTLSNVTQFFAILLSITGQRSTIVFYSTLIVEHPIPLKALEEKTIHTMIRPRPSPANLAADFELYQCVEAFYNGVWWKGVVTKVPGRDGDLLYSVCFLASREEFQFKASEIWRQMKWAKGECINVEDGDQVSD
ncbi:uncharacterized protein A4U43_C04F11290 [Asparagus officinalis]|uniref:Agenet domain-containing protein n=1 Tax=Asparagus officinalis TaxID=4686 RepID=A0A5P1F015_ASPOF|nr:uncharacterized protein A4U43_C04F11290 [Asparagus officinalis]